MTAFIIQDLSCPCQNSASGAGLDPTRLEDMLTEIQQNRIKYVATQLQTLNYFPSSLH